MSASLTDLATGIFQPRQRGGRVDLWDGLRFVRDSHGKSIPSQLLEMLRLRLGPGRLGFHEYFRLGVFDDEAFSFADKAAFIGWRRMQAIHDRYIAREWLGIAHDNLICNCLLSGLGLRQPRLYGLYHPSRGFGSLPTPRDAAALETFLRDGIAYPFFSKPVWGERSIGIASVEALERETDTLILANGGKIAMARFIEQVVTQPNGLAGGLTSDRGYLFMERLFPHPDIEAICGRALSTIRIVVLATPRGPELFRAAWKIPSHGSMADNFTRNGNMVAAVDLPSGRVGDVIGAEGPRRQVLERHPDSGKPLTGIVLPDWQQLCESVLRAGAAIPGLRLQGWDVALTREGPVVIEVNPVGNVRLPQLAGREGFCNPRMTRFLDEIGPAR